MDGDRYIKALQMRYQLLYKQIGQGHFSHQELAHNALRPLMKDVKGYGDEVIVLLGRVADEIESRMGLPMMRELVDRDALKQELEKWAQEIPADPRGKNLALGTYERYIDDMDHATAAIGIHQALIAGYMMEVYTANFESLAYSSLPPTKYGILRDVVVEQLPGIREYVEDYTAQIASSAAKKLSVNGVSLPAAPRVDEIVQIDEILSL